jgi:mono-ADP-ribosyltransferase sirtuin 6
MLAKSDLNSKYGIIFFVVLTGAGISTNAGIPDFRGPNGVWTAEDKEKKTSKQKRRRKSTNPDCDHQSISQALEQTKEQTKDLKKRPRGEENSTSKAVSFDNAKPTTTHYALTRLVEKGIISHVITQNVDGLHLRSGLPRSKLSVLHGCIFTEKCEKCDKEFFRNFDIGGVGFKKTGRICDVTACNGDLRDTVLDWEDELPEADWETSQNYCEMSDLVLTLGTSLRIEPGK